MPIAWIRLRTLDSGPKKGTVQRIARSTIGASIDLPSRDLRRLFVNLAYWCTGLEGQIAGEPKADIVGTFTPTMYGFGAYTRGVKPADFALPASAK